MTLAPAPDTALATAAAAAAAALLPAVTPLTAAGAQPGNEHVTASFAGAAMAQLDTADGGSHRIAVVIEHALCYGWVDSKAVTRDQHSVYLTFTPRNPRSTWGTKNRARAETMIAQGLMAPAGQRLIDHAKQLGTWDALAEAQDGIVPDDLQQALDANPAAAGHFAGFPPSSKTVILEWIATAKRPETRKRRIAETTRLAAENRRAHHY